MTRLLPVLLAALALAAPAAHAQSNPFGPLPQPQAPAATPAPVQAPADQGTVSRSLLFGIAGGVLLLFVGIGMYISRDARQHLTEDDRRAVEGGRERERVDAQRVRGEQVKKKARAKTKAQRQARKRQRQRSGR